MPTVHTLLQGSGLDTTEGTMAFCGVTLVEGPDSSGTVRRYVVDTGHAGRLGVLTAALQRRGLTGSDIDGVVLTHAHWDHMQNLDPFDRAVFLVHPAELNYIADPHPHDFGTPRWTKAVLDLYDIREVVEGTELIPGVSVVAVPGHSAGTIAVVVETGAGTAVVTGDAIQNSAVAVHRRNSLVFWNEEQANRSVGRLVDMADVIHPGHDRAFRLSPGGAVEYVEPFALTLFGLTAGMAGLELAPSPPFAPVIAEPPAR